MRSPPLGMRKRVVVGLLLSSLLGVYLLGLGARRLIVEAQYRQHGNDLPFTLESALHFRRVRMMVEQGELPRVDRALEYPQGVDTLRIYTVGSERVYASLAKLFPSGMRLENRLRWIEAGWFCLGIPLMALWIYWWRGSWVAGLCAAAFYAVALSSVTRSTGLELSRENFALPFLILHLALNSLALRASRGRAFWGAAAGSAVALAMALISWDLVQYYVLLWAGAACVKTLAGRFSADSPGHRAWLLQVLALFLVGWLNPYHAAHGFLLSPGMTLSYGILLALRVRPDAGEGAFSRRRAWTRALLIFLPLLAVAAIPTGYGESYGHFTQLLWAKIRFHNVKPLDPALLDYDARMMWVPALHSATMDLTFRLFPVILHLSILGGVSVLIHSRHRLDPQFLQLASYFGISLIAFVFFVRFHVFLAIFSAALTGVWTAWALRAAGAWGRWTAVILLCVGLTVETGALVREPETWGRSEVYYPELAELIQWSAKNVYPEAVLANFGISASLLGYAGCPLILHPKFETREIRERVREYGEKLFKGTEKEFRDWADSKGAGYYVHGMGEFAAGFPVQYQMRYMVDAVDAPETAPARRFEEKNPERLEYFRLLWENRKYRVYRIRTRADEAEAEMLAHSARQAFERGAMTEAHEEALAALELDRSNRHAAEVLARVRTLWEKGMSYDAGE